ncbi:MAG: MmgE/PrpD family protein [Lachnospiraceae bacterium]|nr:MmgE/PrpD family protein [Lachnospiraceae bacterium]MBR4606729.1 MmgE/PrpD family protein [Lachnospiraceae bacterium]MBR6152544.1 MmgE/PrpD family protein [Lachnospiraceae bacterium]
MNREKLENAIKRQAEFIEALTCEDLSKEVVDQAKLVLLDSIGCMAVGNQYEGENVSLRGDYCVVGKTKSDKITAVFLNGCAMVRNEMDEGNQFASGHPACHFIPAFLAECQEIEALSGKEAIAALVAAYEVSCRWGSSAKANPAMHVHGTMQTAGAAVVVGKLRNYHREEIEKAILLANSLPQMTTWQSAFHGDQIRNAYVGLSNEIGANAYGMIQSGIESSVETLCSVWSDVIGGSIDEEGLVRNLGKDFYVTKNYFKVLAACRYTHSFVDEMDGFMKDGLRPEDIERIEINTYHAASKLSGQHARNSFGAKFSIPISLAIKIIYGELTMESMTNEHVNDERVRELAKRIFVHENLEYNQLLPDIRKNGMKVIKKDGTTLESETEVTKGDYLDPFSKEEVIAKFRNLTAKIWSSDRQEWIIDYVSHLDEKESILKLFEMI